MYKYTCKYCGKEFQNSDKGRKFCCQKCAIVGKIYWNKGKKGLQVAWNKATEDTINVCQYCGKKYKIRPHHKNDAKYCSRICSTKSQTKQITKICQCCGEKFERTPSELKKGGKYCSLECKYEMSRGRNGNNWKGGISFMPYSPDFTEQLKELIRHRDGFKCQLCGCSEVENNQKLDVHHIDYNKSNCNPLNLVSLCHRCNSVVNFGRDRWERLFNRKVNKIMRSNKIQLSFRSNKTRSESWL